MGFNVLGLRFWIDGRRYGPVCVGGIWKIWNNIEVSHKEPSFYVYLIAKTVRVRLGNMERIIKKRVFSTKNQDVSKILVGKRIN